MVSVIGDGWKNQFHERYKLKDKDKDPLRVFREDSVSVQELNALRVEVIELRKLLEAAKKFDRATGQPDCEMDEKVKLIRSLAEQLRVDLGDVLGRCKT